MIRLACLILLLLLYSSNLLAANLPADFVKRGSGTVNYLGFIKVYDAEFFTAPEVRRAEVLEENASRCLQLNYAVSLTVENFVEAAEKILARQHEPSILAKIREEVDLLHKNYQKVEEGDQYLLCYDATSKSTSLQLNENVLVTVNSPEFAKIYFGIWLGEIKPIDTKLRNRLLSGFNS